MHVATPSKIVLPSIGPLFASCARSFQPRPMQALPSLPDITSSSLWSPTPKQSFGTTFTLSPTMQRDILNKPIKLTGNMTLKRLEIEAAFQSPSGPTSPTDVDNFPCEDDSTRDDGVKLRISRERNRLHAQRTRSRKRELIENLKDNITSLQNEYSFLKHAYELHLTAICLLSLGDKRVSKWFQGLEEMLDALSNNDHVAEAVGSDKSALILNDESYQLHQLAKNQDIYSNPPGESLSTSPTATASKEERDKERRERNRLHARRARLRKKIMLERSQKSALLLYARNENLRARLGMLVTMIYESRPFRWPEA